MKPLQVQVLRSAYVVGRKQVRTVAALEAELIRLDPKEACVLPDLGVPYRKVAAALRVLQKRGVLIGMVGSVRNHSLAAGK